MMQGKQRKPLEGLSRLYAAMLCAGVMIFLGGCGRLQENQESDTLPIEELPHYLAGTAAGVPYAYAEVTVEYPGLGGGSGKGGLQERTASVSWKFMGAEEACREEIVRLEDTYRSGQEQNRQDIQSDIDTQDNGQDNRTDSGPDGGRVKTHWLYFQYQLEENTYGMDLHAYLQEHYGSPQNQIRMVTGGGGSSYRFSQSYNREVIVKDGMVYALICLGIPPKESVNPINELFLDFVQEIQEDGGISSGWVMDEERLYWADHVERVTILEEPARTFTEALGRDQDHWDTIMERFGLLKEAVYQVEISQEGPAVQIQFSFPEDIPENGYEAFRLNGFCADEAYEMKVTRMEDGAVLQSGTMQLCIEKTDTVDFGDLDGDGYLDMQVSWPSHWNGRGAVMDEYASMGFWLWNPETENFEWKSLREIEARRRDNSKDNSKDNNKDNNKDNKDNKDNSKDNIGENIEKAETETTFLVEKGDCLWDIARRIYGRGSCYAIIYEANSWQIGEDPSLIPVGMELLIPALH